MFKHTQNIYNKTYIAFILQRDSEHYSFSKTVSFARSVPIVAPK